MTKTVQLPCPHCGHTIEVGVRFAGSAVRCPECRAECVVPDAEAEPAYADVLAGTSETAATDGAAEKPEGTPSDKPSWMLRVPEGLQFGPIPHALLQQWLLEGRIDGECQLRREADVVWRAADEEFPILKTASPVSQESTPSAQKMVPEPPAGLFVLILTILGWIALCPLLGLLGWLAAREDLTEIEAGRRRDDQRSWSLAAVRLAQIQLLTTIVLLLGMLALVLFGGLANNLGW